MHPWNLKHLKAALDNDLLECHTALERQLCRTIGGKEIRARAHEIAATRKLTPGEAAIAAEFGYPAA